MSVTPAVNSAAADARQLQKSNNFTNFKQTDIVDIWSTFVYVAPLDSVIADM